MDFNKFKIIAGKTPNRDKYTESLFLAKTIKEYNIKCAIVFSNTKLSNCDFFVKSVRTFHEENLQHRLIFIPSDDNFVRINQALYAIERNENVIIFDCGGFQRCQKFPNVDCVMLRGSRLGYSDYITDISHCLEYSEEKESKVLLPLFTKSDAQNFKSIINTIKCVNFSRNMEKIELYCF